ncbi:MAG: exodeoxyribonuclease VII large subunit, partial [Clostridia bacterium]|nr:exodeoxyribonuclease VII large subunit [Clostridia bacterium]
MQDGRQYFSITQLNEYVRMLLDGNAVLSDMWIQGEISNFTNQYRTGHLYFSLKDSGATVRVVMFRSYASRLGFEPKDGMKVVLHGRVSAYGAGGQYQ